MSNLRSVIIGVLLAPLVCGARSLHAQAAARRDSIEVSILTMGPGPEIYDKFGHISLRLRDLRTGVDVAFNWGMFDFEQPHFLQRFLTGDTRYWMQGFPTVPLVNAYRGARRRVTEQVLNLSAAQADSLLRFVQWTALEDHKYYRYDYYRDNCSTRVRDALDGVLGGALRRAMAAREHGISYRSETIRLGAAHPFLNVGMDFALGRKADATLSAWDEMFVPMRLADLMRDVKVRRADGSVVPLVRSESTLVADDTYKERDTQPNLVPVTLTVGAGFAALITTLALVITTLAARGRRATAVRLVVGSVATVWHLVAGAVGLLVLCLGLFTHHLYMSQNMSLLLGTPASLALAALIPFAMSGAYPRAAKAARALSMFTAAAAVLATILFLFPGLAQQNWPVLALAAPLHLSINAMLAHPAVTAPRSAEPQAASK